MRNNPDYTRCGNCGKAINLGLSWRIKRFCCDKCRLAYWASHSDELNKKAYYDFHCQECGEPFQAYGNAKRKYCTRSCYALSKRHPHLQKEIEPPPSQTVPVQGASMAGSDPTIVLKEVTMPRKDPKVGLEEAIRRINDPAMSTWEKAMYLRESSLSCKRISNVLGISYNTVKSWCRRYYGAGQSAGSTRTERPIKTADDWRILLTQATQDFHCVDRETATNGRPVIFICGVISGNKGPDILSSIIEHTMRMDPFSGDVFAFCGRSRDRIKYIHWDGGGFHVVSRRREHGAYFWPPRQLGRTITVSAREFEYILRGSEGR